MPEGEHVDVDLIGALPVRTERPFESEVLHDLRADRPQIALGRHFHRVRPVDPRLPKRHSFGPVALLEKRSVGERNRTYAVHQEPRHKCQTQIQMQAAIEVGEVHIAAMNSANSAIPPTIAIAPQRRAFFSSHHIQIPEKTQKITAAMNRSTDTAQALSATRPYW